MTRTLSMLLAVFILVGCSDPSSSGGAVLKKEGEEPSRKGVFPSSACKILPIRKEPGSIGLPAYSGWVTNYLIGQEARYWIGGFSNLSGADLRSMQLCRASLFYAELENTRLDRANLSFAFMHNINGKGVQLSGANMQNVGLVMARLAKAQLSGTNLTNADLTYAMLPKANLTRANLKGASFFWSDLRGSNLTGVVNAELANWEGAQFDQTTICPNGQPWGSGAHNCPR